MNTRIESIAARHREVVLGLGLAGVGVPWVPEVQVVTGRWWARHRRVPAVEAAPDRRHPDQGVGAGHRLSPFRKSLMISRTSSASSFNWSKASWRALKVAPTRQTAP